MIEKGSLPADQMKDRTTEATPATPEDRDGSEDVVYLVGATEDGEGMNALRSRGGEIEIAQIRALEEGESIVGSELVSLRPRELPFVCDVEVIHDAGRRASPPTPARCA